VEGQTPKTAETVAEEIQYANERGGNFLLGIGPMADGRIDPEHVAILEKVGKILVDSRR
jgi:alpha-L-fucosidase